MKTLTFLMSLCIFANLAYSQTNLLTNGDFETGQKEPWGGWNFTVSKKNVYEGIYSGQTEVNYKGNAAINQKIMLEANKHYRWTMYAQTAKASFNATVFVDQLSGSYLSMPLGNTEWTKYEFIFSPDNDTAEWRLGLWKGESGAVETDSWELVEIDPNSYSSENSITATGIGVLDNTNKKITKIIRDAITAKGLLTNITLSNLAHAYIYSDTTHMFTGDDEILGTDDFIRVFAENGGVQRYDLEFTISYLTTTTHGTIDHELRILSNVSDTIKAAELLSHLSSPEGTTIQILDGPGGTAVTNPTTTKVTNTMVVEVAMGDDKTEYSIETRTYSNEKEIISSSIAILDAGNKTLTIKNGMLAAQLYTTIEVSDKATFTIVDQSDALVDTYVTLLDNMYVKVKAESGQTNNYNLIISGTLTAEVWDDKTDTLEQAAGKVIELKGNSSLYFLGTASELKGCVIDIQSSSSFVFLPNIAPIDTTQELLMSFAINKKPLKALNMKKVHEAELASEPIPVSNAMIRQYYAGTVVSAYDFNGFEAGLIGYTGTNFTGNSKNYRVGYHRGDSAYVIDATSLKSFKLKRGFMATICTAIHTDKATGEDNTFDLATVPYWYVTNSRIYIAANTDYEVEKIENNLYGKANYIIVTPWTWVSKKGVCTHNKQAHELNASWKYNWWTAQDNESYPGYVPMIKGKGHASENSTWDALMYMGENPYRGTYTHLLGFNEPTAVDQGNISVDEMIQAWPRLLETGARLGSPAPREGGQYLQNLYNFMQKAEQKGYRVDYIAFHWYDWGNWGSSGNPDADAEGIFNRFKAYIENVYNTYQLPIWITEFNANKNRNTAVQKAFLELALPYLESTDYIERYAYFEPAGGLGNFFTDSQAADEFTELGILYRDLESTPSQTGEVIYGHNNLPDGVVGIDRVTAKKSDIQLYPNPVNNNILYFNNLNSDDIQIFDMLGRKQNVSISDNYIDLQGLPEGVYYLRSNTDVATFLKR